MVLVILRFIVIALALWLFIRADRSVSYGRRGFLFVQVGFLLLLFASFMEIVKIANNPGWSASGRFGPSVHVVEMVSGLAGGVLLLSGLWLWLPSIRTMGEVQEKLDRTKADLEEHFLARTSELEEEVGRRCRAETEGRISEERRRILFENSPVGISHGYIGGRFVERNMAYARMLGYDSPEEMARVQALEGDTFSHVVDSEDVALIVERARTEEFVQGLVVRMRRRDDVLRWIRLDMAMARDRHGKNYYFYAFALDVTERKEHADGLDRARRRLKKILDTLPVGVFVVDRETRTLIGANPMALRMSGYTHDELVGMPCRGILCGDGSSCPVFEGEGGTCVDENWLTTRDGGRLPVFKNMVATKVDGRESLVVSLLDISEQKRLEDLREDVNRIVVHDLKAPVIGVINVCRYLLMEEESMDAELREMLQAIELQAEKALRMIGLSLDLYKIEIGTYAYEPEPIDLMEVVRLVRDNLAATAEERGLAVEVLLDGLPDAGEELPVPANALLLETMVANLLLNALEAAPRGGAVSVRAERGDPVALTIGNSGAVPVELRGSFFDKYATGGKKGGTGLGTYSARLAASAMGGNIGLSVSDEEDTTSVRVTLPGA
ncbi:PAS domain S-box protein [Pseudodesulfovibrio thermohalotolerans]|uniref:PAS domain-containing sensor histidine kinase n=1 Tax=Pseudodesulfovibrio thermohalotolerans TaxID=2880651 RepID=UPI0024431A57|nr:PAS domain S-box protein [Pseudodesulfovibrio thermohalotolerans]WFS64316.1 PAS domain S-box protein [Pseudodesulfovibrio thermohalotolerans]